MTLFRRSPSLTPQQSLAAKPVRLVAADLSEIEGGGGRLTVPLRQTRWGGWLFGAPAGAQKTFELDALGAMVWRLCDGRNSVQQIIRKLAKQYQLSAREAEVSTRQFLLTLARKGLVGLNMKDARSGRASNPSKE